LDKLTNDIDIDVKEQIKCTTCSRKPRAINVTVIAQKGNVS